MFKLQQHDFINIGIEQDFQINTCTSHVRPGQDSANEYINIRWVPDGISQFLSKDLLSDRHICPSNKDPTLEFENKTGISEMEGHIVTLKYSTKDKILTMKQYNKETVTINGGKCRIGAETDNHIQNTMKGVSLYHCQIFYNEQFGWVIEDVGT